jgi:hypothetical protein
MCILVHAVPFFLSLGFTIVHVHEDEDIFLFLFLGYQDIDRVNYFRSKRTIT